MQDLGECQAEKGCEERQEVAKADFREVRIQRVTNGFVVKVGCRTFVADNWTTVCLALQEYFTDPYAAEVKYTKQTNIN